MSVNFYGMNCAGPSGFAMFGRQDTSERFLRRACLGRLQPRRLLLRRGGLGWRGFFLGDTLVLGWALVISPEVWGWGANRSGEGRGGEEGRSPWAPDYLKKKRIDP